MNAGVFDALVTVNAENKSADERIIAKAEKSYFYRVMCSHMHEALNDFEKCWKSGMIERYRPLEVDGEHLYDQLKIKCQDKALLEYLKTIRNKTFHYGYDGELLNEGLAVFGDGQTAANCRYIIAEDAIMSRIHESLDLCKGDAALLELQKKVTMLRNEMLHFVDRFVVTIYQRHPAAFSRQPDLDSDGELS